MWIILGIDTLVSTIINIYFGINKHVYTKWATAFALSFISLTVLSQYFMVKNWVELEDWSALLDVVPIMTTALTIFTVIFLTVNIFVLWNASKK